MTGVECLQDPLSELERVRQERDALRLETERLRVRDCVAMTTSVYMIVLAGYSYKVLIS